MLRGYLKNFQTVVAQHNAGVMYGKPTFITDFNTDYVIDFYFTKVSCKVNNKVGNESQLPIHDSSINVI